MVDQWSVELLEFNFACRTFVYGRVALGLSRFVSAASIFMHEYLDPAVSAVQCAQYEEEFEIAANNATVLIGNLEPVFQSIHQPGLKLTLKKCHFAIRRKEFLGRTAPPERILPKLEKFTIFLVNSDSRNQKRHYSAT